MLLDLLREGGFHPVVAERLPLTDARHAHELLEGPAATGRLVLIPWRAGSAGRPAGDLGPVSGSTARTYRTAGSRRPSGD